jgi:hypothetical protein
MRGGGGAAEIGSRDPDAVENACGLLPIALQPRDLGRRASQASSPQCQGYWLSARVTSASLVMWHRVLGPRAGARLVVRNFAAGELEDSPSGSWKSCCTTTTPKGARAAGFVSLPSTGSWPDFSWRRSRGWS